MELLAALRALRSRKSAFIIQVLALTVGVMTLILCAQLYGAMTHGSQISGVQCGTGMRRLALNYGDESWSLRFTKEQARLIQKALPHAAFRVAPLAMEVSSKSRVETRSVVALDTGLFEQFCIPINDGSWPRLGARQAVVPAAFNSETQLRVGVAAFEVVGRNSAFEGLPSSNASAIYIPFDQLESSGLDIGRVGMPVVQIIADVSGGKAEVTKALEVLVQENPAAFSPGSVVDIQRLSPLGPDEVKRLERFTLILGIVGVAFVVLGLATVLSYQLGRTGSIAATATLFRELGAPRRAVLLYCAAEPLLAFGCAVLAALLIGQSLSHVIGSWLGLALPSAPISSQLIALGAFALLGATASVGFGAVLRHFAENQMGRALKRRIQHAFSYVVAIQFFIGCVVALPAVAAALAFWFAIPKDRGYDIENIRVDTIFLPGEKIPADFQGRLGSFLSIIERGVSGRSALAWSTYPVPGISGLTSAVEHNGVRATLQINPVTPSYFDVLSMRVVEGRRFDDSELPASKDETPVVAVANAEAVKVLKIDSIPSSPISIGKENSFFRAKVSVVGVVDEKTSGTNSSRSADRLGPALYVPWRPQGPFLILTKHAGVDNARIAPLIASALDAYVPAWREAEIPNRPTTLEALYREATAEQRTTFSMFGALAGSALLLGLLGLIGSAVMVLSLNKLSYAIMESLGAHRQQLLKRHVLLVARPLLPALLVSVFVCALVSNAIADIMLLPSGSAVALVMFTIGCILSFALLGLLISAKEMKELDLTKSLLARE